MIKIEHVEVWGFEHAIRGMRNPMNSWEKSDSEYKRMCSSLGPNEEPHWCNHCGYDACDPYFSDEEYVIGPNDLELMRKLYKAGTEHRKYMRQIMVSMDVTAPLYWWKEADTYKVGTVANSCSTMHKIHSKEFALDDFSWDQLLNTDCDLFELEWGEDCKTMVQPQHFMIDWIIPVLNICRDKYLETKDKKYWWQMIQLLPSSYNQRRTLMLNYEVLSHIYKDRKEHKLDEWREFCNWIETLPFAKVLICNVAKGGETE